MIRSDEKSLFLKLWLITLSDTWTHSGLDTCVLRLRFPEDTSSRNVTPIIPSLFPFHQFRVVSRDSAAPLSHHSKKILLSSVVLALYEDVSEN